METGRQLVEDAQRLSAATGEAELGAADLIMKVIEGVRRRRGDGAVEADAAASY